MDIVWLLSVLIIVTSDATAVNQDSNKAEIEQKILLRKLQKRSDPRDDANSVTWNEILADVLINKIRIFSFNRVEEPEPISTQPKGNIVTQWVSQMLAIYKTFYDKYRKDTRESASLQINELEPVSINPKEEFEVIETSVKEPCDECIDNGDALDDKMCPKGQVVNEAGVCEDTKPTKMILGVPKQCPIGFRADRLGYCRRSF